MTTKSHDLEAADRFVQLVVSSFISFISFDSLTNVLQHGTAMHSLAGKYFVLLLLFSAERCGRSDGRQFVPPFQVQVILPRGE